jgi:hypothetical protein
MVDILSMVDLTSISAILAAIGVFVGVIFAILQLRDLVKTRQTDLVMRLYSTFGSRELQEAWLKSRIWEFKDYSDFMRKYDRKTKIGMETWVLLNSVASFYEGIGILLYRKLIDIKLVDDLFSTPIKLTWETIKPIVEGQRKHYERPQIWEWFEYLYNEMQKREQQLTTVQ